MAFTPVGTILVIPKLKDVHMRLHANLAVLHATYYASSDQHPPAPQSDLIVPLSTLLNNTGNDASVPPGFSVRTPNDFSFYMLTKLIQD